MAASTFAMGLLRWSTRPSTVSVLLKPCTGAVITSTASISNSSSQSAAVTTPNLIRRKGSRKAEPVKKANYQFRPPRFYRGPLAPVQPPPPSSPESREFVPGPFTSERLADHYHNTIAPDLMTLTYDHLPYGYKAPVKAPRLRPWDESSPYYKNRPLRGPRGGNTLRLLTPPRTFHNVPTLTGITVHSMAKGAITDKGYIVAAGIALQSITGVRATVHNSKTHVAPFSLKDDYPIAVSCHLVGMQAWRFLSSCVDVVMPRIKDYRGVRGSSGDSSGNITFGFTPEEVTLFPEIEVNYDMYPPRMIPGCHVTVHTSATNDRDARLLLSSFGVPFYGRLID